MARVLAAVPAAMLMRASIAGSSDEKRRTVGKMAERPPVGADTQHRLVLRDGEAGLDEPAAGSFTGERHK